MHLLQRPKCYSTSKVRLPCFLERVIILFACFARYTWIFSMSLNNVNVIFCSWLLPQVAPGPGSPPHGAGAVSGSHYLHSALPACSWLCPLGEAVPALGSPWLPVRPPLQSSPALSVPTCPDAGRGWPCSSFSKRIRRLHHLSMNQLCDAADIHWDVHLCPVSHFRCCICTLDCSWPRVSLMLVLSSCVS